MEENIEKIIKLIDSYKSGQNKDTEEELTKNKPSSEPYDFSEMKKSIPAKEDLFRYDLKTLERLQYNIENYSDFNPKSLIYIHISKQIEIIKKQTNANP